MFKQNKCRPGSFMPHASSGRCPLVKDGPQLAASVRVTRKYYRGLAPGPRRDVSRVTFPAEAASTAKDCLRVLGSERTGFSKF